MNYPLSQAVGVTSWSRERAGAPGDEARDGFRKRYGDSMAGVAAGRMHSL